MFAGVWVNISLDSSQQGVSPAISGWAQPAYRELIKRFRLCMRVCGSEREKERERETKCIWNKARERTRQKTIRDGKSWIQRQRKVTFCRGIFVIVKAWWSEMLCGITLPFQRYLHTHCWAHGHAVRLWLRGCHIHADLSHLNWKERSISFFRCSLDPVFWKKVPSEQNL